MFSGLAILRKHPGVRGVLFDVPHVARRAEADLAGTDIADRWRIVGGDFFGAVPAGGDAYVVSQILHDWDEARCVAILKQCRQAMPSHAKLLVAELMLPEGDAPFFGKWLDLHMLVLAGGRERTAVEYEELLHAAGFAVTRVVTTPIGASVVEAVPV
jgi:hypothetical protein